MSLTPNQRAVLEKLAASDVPLHSRDFADIATVQSGRWEWANPILKGILPKALVARGAQKSWKGFGWTITPEGRQALAEKQLDPEEVTPCGPLSEAMKAEMLWIARCEAQGEEVEAFGRRMTHEALARRGLISVLSVDRGWRTLVLTKEGRELSKELRSKLTSKP